MARPLPCVFHFHTNRHTVIVTAIPPEDAAEGMLIDVNEIIDDLPPESLKNENSTNALSNKINAALELIELG